MEATTIAILCGVLAIIFSIVSFVRTLHKDKVKIYLTYPYTQLNGSSDFASEEVNEIRSSGGRGVFEDQEIAGKSAFHCMEQCMLTDGCNTIQFNSATKDCYGYKDSIGTGEAVPLSNVTSTATVVIGHTST